MLYKLQTHTQQDNGHASLLEKRFCDTILLLTYNELDGHSKAQWLVQLEQIKDFITKKNISLVIMDVSGEPSNLDYDHNGYCTTRRQMLNMLSVYCRTIIITDDWRYYYKPDKDIKFFSQGLWHQSQRNLHEYYTFQDTVYDTTIEKTKTLMCLNRNLEWHRIYLLYLLHQNDWFPLVDYSFIMPLNDRLDHPDDLGRPAFTDEEISTLKKINLPIRLEGEINPAVGFTNGASSVNLPVYEQNAINVVTETSTTNNPGVCLTEKTAKAIMAYQIPILVSNRGASQWLEDVGIDMFSDYIPWQEWDLIQDDRKRIHAIANFIDITMRDPNKILEEHRNFHPRLVANKQRFHSQEFGDLLIAQIT